MTLPPLRELNLRKIETVFLDVGNTLVSIDFSWVQRELAALGFETTTSELRRAEAAARPEVSRRICWHRSERRSEWVPFLHQRGILQVIPELA